MRLLNRVKYNIDSMRQDAREGVPKNLAKLFKGKLTKAQWEGMHYGIGKTDILALGMVEAQALLEDPSSVGARILAAEEVLQKHAAPLADRYKTKARVLARYMVRGEVTSQNLLKNARAIAGLFGEVDRPKPENIDERVEPAIEKLIALYAYELLPQSEQEMLQDLAENQAEGLKAVLGMTETLRKLEEEKLTQVQTDDLAVNQALNNGWAGFLPEQTADGAQVVVKDISEHEHMISRGWVRIGAYNGDGNEGYRGKRAYYQSSVAGKSPFRQGLAQSVHSTFRGTNVMTGRSLTGMAGTITGKKAEALAQAISEAKAGSLDNVPNGEYLIPFFDGKGNVIPKQKSNGFSASTVLH
ncbi:hypothetical protein FHS66_003605 [Pacificitalea manganoxidans]|nr:hypothetical protein [Pacificitalea manganoxidans]